MHLIGYKQFLFLNIFGDIKSIFGLYLINILKTTDKISGDSPLTASSNVWMDNCHKMSISDKFLSSDLSDDLSSNKLESRNFVRNSYIQPPISSFFQLVFHNALNHLSEHHIQ